MKKYKCELSIKMLEYFKYYRFYKGLSCPHCGTPKVVRNGKFNGKQRYLCKKCGKTFSDFTSTPFYMTHYLDKWPIFMEYSIKGLSLRKSAKLLGVSHVTLFNWRHKLLAALEKNKAKKLNGVIEVDNIYLRYSQKGQKYIQGRTPYKRGKGFFYSFEDLIIVMAASDYYNNLVSKVICYFNFYTPDVEAIIGKFVNKSTILCTNSNLAFRFYAQKTKVKHYRIGFGYKDKVYNIDIAKKYLHDFERWLRRFKGVATKYLNHYLALYKFLHDFNFDATQVGIKGLIEAVSIK